MDDVAACKSLTGHAVLDTNGSAADEHIAPRDDTHNRWYVVTAGRRVGIWRDWLHMSDFVNRVPGNAHKSFATRAEAEQHYFTAKNEGRVEVIMP